MNMNQLKLRDIIVNGASAEAPLKATEILTLCPEGLFTINTLTSTLTQLIRVDRNVWRERKDGGKWVYWYDPTKKMKVTAKRLPRKPTPAEVDFALGLTPEPQPAPPTVTATELDKIGARVMNGDVVLIQYKGEVYVAQLSKMEKL